MTRSILAVSAAVLAFGCTAPQSAVPGPAPATAPTVAPVADPPPPPAPPAAASVPMPSAQPIMPPADALRAGWMPLSSTGVDTFRREHSTWDGRGVLIGILDSGIDAGVSGLGRTSTGEPKLLDLRDFSGEGSIALTPVDVRSDSVDIDGRRLRAPEGAGAARLWGGTFAELPLGELPAADVNGDGDAEDLLPLLVTRSADEWLLFADTDADGSFADEKPVRDYLVARETFGWAAPNGIAPLTVAANFSQERIDGVPLHGLPVLDLFFDTSAHGTHVAGIAAGHNMYDVPGFDGVAPGAQVLGLKIANDAQGGISTTGAMVRAMDYAIRFAAERKLPLVLNLSFGVGNEVEGRARIDALVDSILAAHPDVVFTISAGNDGPGFSTLGFPGSARRAISVGALMPGVFLSESPEGKKVSDQIASFSSRGGELSAPDLLTPGVAYSTVPRWNVGGEREGGTSMASPHAAGLAALLRSALVSERRSASAQAIRQALMASAHPVSGAMFIDEGAGIPNVGKALALLAKPSAAPLFEIRSGTKGDGVFLAQGLPFPGDTLQRVRLRRIDGSAPLRLSFRSSAAWLHVPAAVPVGSAPVTISVRLDRAPLTNPGVHAAVLTAWTADTTAGPVARIATTVVVPHPARSADLAPDTVTPGNRLRVPFLVERGHATRVRVETVWGPGASVWLHEPGGMPFRSGAQLRAGQGNDAAAFDITAGEAVGGVYELVVEPPPTEGAAVRVSIHHAPVEFRAERDGDAVQVTLRGLNERAAEVEPGVLLTGAAQEWSVQATGDERPRKRVVIPRWARALQVDVNMDRDQWNRFTDLGMTLFDTAGRQIGKTPLNYAFGRLEILVPEAMRGQPADLVWFPGFADAVGEANRTWRLEVQARFYADSATALPRADETALTVEKGGTRTLRMQWRMPPWGETPEQPPLGAVLMRSGDDTFIREMTFGPATATTRATAP